MSRLKNMTGPLQLCSSVIFELNGILTNTFPFNQYCAPYFDFKFISIHFAAPVLVHAGDIIQTAFPVSCCELPHFTQSKRIQNEAQLDSMFAILDVVSSPTGYILQFIWTCVCERSFIKTWSCLQAAAHGSRWTCWSHAVCSSRQRDNKTLPASAHFHTHRAAVCRHVGAVLLVVVHGSSSKVWEWWTRREE